MSESYLLAASARAAGAAPACASLPASTPSGGDTSSANEEAARKPLRLAWITLLTNSAYASGVKALSNSLSVVDTEYPLVVMLTDGVPPEVQAELAALDGCELLRVEPLALPAGSGDRQAAYLKAHFAECWTKLRLWEQTQFERVVYLDADMVVLKNMDELLERDDGCGRSLPDDGGAGACRIGARIGAVHECFCAVPRGCVACAHLAPMSPKSAPPPPPPGSYFNAGLLVLRPSRAVFEHMTSALAAFDLSACPFAEQDFLNDYFRGAWAALPWYYNATKTLYACHREDGSHRAGNEPSGTASGSGRPALWALNEVRNLHFTMAKPWNLKDPAHKGFERLNKLWWAALAEPNTLSRVLLQMHLKERRAATAAAVEAADQQW